MFAVLFVYCCCYYYYFSSADCRNAKTKTEERARESNVRAKERSNEMKAWYEDESNNKTHGRGQTRVSRSMMMLLVTMEGGRTDHQSIP